MIQRILPTNWKLKKYWLFLLLVVHIYINIYMFSLGLGWCSLDYNTAPHWSPRGVANLREFGGYLFLTLAKEAVNSHFLYCIVLGALVT